jgi:hypothetical protein
MYTYLLFIYIIIFSYILGTVRIEECIVIIHFFSTILKNKKKYQQFFNTFSIGQM